MDEQTMKRQRTRSYFVAGVLVGVLGGISITFGPIIGFGLVAALAVVSLTVQPRSAAFAGLMIGAGGVYTYAAVRTIAACLQTAEFCGQANVAPFLGIAVAVLLVGVCAAAATVRVGRA